jgi:c-di-GMP-binding flagellar brake protein YcgR
MIQSAITLGDRIELTKKIEMEEAESFYSIIYELVDDKHMLIQAPIEGGKVMPLELEVVYYACIYTNRGLFRGEVEVTKRLKDDNLHYLELTFITPMKKYQRRQYYRMNCILSFKYKDVEDESWDTGTLLDISGGGIRFSTTSAMKINYKIRCHLELRLRDYTISVETEGIILQSKPVTQDRVHYQNRILFEELSLENREKIIKFIFEEERRRRKKEKGM